MGVRIGVNFYRTIGILSVVFLQIQFKKLALVVSVNRHRHPLVSFEHHQERRFIHVVVHKHNALLSLTNKPKKSLKLGGALITTLPHHVLEGNLGVVVLPCFFDARFPKLHGLMRAEVNAG